MNGFCEKLKKLRENAGLSQKQLADRAGVSQKAISFWETGGREPSWSAVQTLAAALGITCEAFADAPKAKNSARKSESRKHGRAQKGK